MSNHQYTVVIPAFNAGKYIAETLQSVLSQSIPPTKIIVVDDGSSDDTARIALQTSSIVNVISTPNRGPGAATTTGIAAVQTDIVAMVDSDDLWHPSKMEIQLEQLNHPHHHIDAVITKMRPFGELHLKNAAEESSGWSRSTLAIWMHAYHRVGEIRDLGHGYGEMIDWFSRAKHAGLNIKLVDQALALRRIHSESISFNANVGQAKDYLRAAVLAFHRKKQLS
ncbi:MAG TPA: glycosyltransferase family A protein [Burkholderiaceae bacterium]|nr:glycosyltransferase family A protein [Burkholderiaceae bacterium]